MTHGNHNQGGQVGQQVGSRLASAGTALMVARMYRGHGKTKAKPVAAPGAAYKPSNLLDDSQYPQTWDAYIGQDDAKALLKSAVKRAQDRDEKVRHVLIACPEPGIGKTALAVLLAREIGGRCFAITGTPTPAQVRDIILATRPGDVLFIDEIHRLVNGGKSKAEWLLHVLQDDALMDGTGMIKGNLGITVVGATTDAELLPETILDRFGVKPVLQHHDPDDAMTITFADARRLFPPLALPPIQDLMALSFAGDCNPRRMKQLVEQAIDCHYDPQGYSVERVLERAGVTIDGLDRLAQRYLDVLLDSRGTMGQAQLKSRLQTPNLDYCERRLADKGLVVFTATGRALTPEGTERAMELRAASDA